MSVDQNEGPTLLDVGDAVQTGVTVIGGVEVKVFTLVDQAAMSEPVAPVEIIPDIAGYAAQQFERGRLMGWTEADKHLQTVAGMHGDPQRARNLYADAEMLLAANGKRDGVHPETTAQSAAQPQGEAGE